jgi:hypothetical protein
MVIGFVVLHGMLAGHIFAHLSDGRYDMADE